MKRKIIQIDQSRCNGCGDCIPNCPEGAIQVIDGKARLISDQCCDGLGACIGHCPQGAILIEEREAAPYSERLAMAHILPQGTATIRAHLRHLRDHGEHVYLREALAVLAENGLPDPLAAEAVPVGGCPGARQQVLRAPSAPAGAVPADGPAVSRLTHWPVQLHLIAPHAPAFQGADLLLAADCTAYALADFHQTHLSGRALAIACPKLDAGQDVYLEKLTALIDVAGINTLTVMIMQVPCCGGLLRLAQAALQRATRQVPLKCVVVSIKGEILKEEQIRAVTGRWEAC